MDTDADAEAVVLTTPCSGDILDFEELADNAFPLQYRVARVYF